MMSSDSDDDCYGNIAQKLNSIKSKFKEDKLEITNLLGGSSKPVSKLKKLDKPLEVIDISDKVDCEALTNNSDGKEMSLDAIIAKNSKKRVTRSKRTADISIENILPARTSRKKSRGDPGKKSSGNEPSYSQTSESVITNPSINIESRQSVDPPVPRGRGRRKRGRGKSRSNTSVMSVTSVDTPTPTYDDTTNTPETLNVQNNSPSDLSNTSIDRRRGRGRGRQSTPRRRGRRMCLHDFLFPILNLPVPSGSSNLPTYSVGNTDEYPDESYNQPLFTRKTNDVIVVEETEPANDSLDENEELSVKIYWQNCEYVKFTLRRFQKLTQIFDYFSNRENISHDKLFFTYNDKILKIDDTPDSIDYNIVKFIDGGIINQSVSQIVQKDRNTAKDGIKLKFQSQNVKKLFETTIRLDDKMSVAMMMCSEHFEKPLNKLKFFFDGDLISGKNTPRELELEGGECIDVKINS